MIRKIKILLEMIKFEHTVFALPFALTGAFLAGRAIPDATVFAWVVLAMVGARTSAMGFNRIVDRHFDLRNPRTADRALPAGTVALAEAWLMVILSALLFFFACYNLNRLTLVLAPFALSLTYLYSLTKRFTWLCHVVLGIALAFSPFGGWVAVQGAVGAFPFSLSVGVLFWVAGFDTLYACMDADFDRQQGLYSLPSRFGRKNAFRLAVLFHVLAFVLFAWVGLAAALHPVYYVGVFFTGAALFYQHIVVTPKDLTRIQLSFFTLNGLISLVLFVSIWLALVLESVRA